MVTALLPPLDPAVAIVPPADRISKRELERRVAALKSMSGAELRNEYRLLFGIECYSHNYAVLRDRCKWRLYTLCHGHLSAEALRYAATLSDFSRLRERQPAIRRATTWEEETVHLDVPCADTTKGTTVADFMAVPGRAIRKKYKGRDHIVHSLSDGRLLYNCVEYGSVTAVAKIITGYKCSGNDFFKDAERITQ